MAGIMPMSVTPIGATPMHGVAIGGVRDITTIPMQRIVIGTMCVHTSVTFGAITAT